MIFWNLIYYFNEHNLPFDCILPYETEDFNNQMLTYSNFNKKVITVQKSGHKTNATGLEMQRQRSDVSAGSIVGR